MKQLRINKYKVATVISLFLLVITPMMNKLVNAMFRSGVDQQSGFGSECLLWLFPIMVVGLLEAVSNKVD